MVWGPAVWDSRDYTQVTIPFIRGSLESQTTKLQLVWDIGGVHSWKLDGKHQWCSMLDGKHIYAQSEVIKKEKTLHGVNVIGVSGMLIATKATTRTTRRKHYEEEDHRHHHHHHQVFTDNTVKADRWWHRFFWRKWRLLEWNTTSLRCGGNHHGVRGKRETIMIFVDERNPAPVDEYSIDSIHIYIYTYTCTEDIIISEFS